MKSLHRPDLYGWSTFNPARNIDFNGIAWVRPEGNILVDPVALSNHDWNHLQSLGGVHWIVLTNSEHIRSAKEIADQTYAKIAGPVGEKDNFPIHCDRWLADGDQVVPGLEVLELQGSKTPGELALLLEETTLITGDLVRARKAGSLTILPEEKLLNREAAMASIKRLAALPQIEAVLVGDGWPVFRDGGDRLQELLATL
ncbi:MBL fold metallo-hydrolase [Nodularia harveyana UHCC-0300]|uniref:MBL fold metallo-hydrolase n=1 Tax=Nodularia harveyana UHCC-0300 TaxID=2974287 RepID=A0ABU5UA62_9CYAN|nr:MBL fold metallo-hydrolase [Nodularia harveyana]MEA5580414.1 MBL fold metallo-hydrolase [Nodularia harveyana UHCC-0300]